MIQSGPVSASGAPSRFSKSAENTHCVSNWLELHAEHRFLTVEREEQHKIPEGSN